MALVRGTGGVFSPIPYTHSLVSSRSTNSASDDHRPSLCTISLRVFSRHWRPERRPLIRKQNLAMSSAIDLLVFHSLAYTNASRLSSRLRPG